MAENRFLKHIQPETQAQTAEQALPPLPPGTSNRFTKYAAPEAQPPQPVAARSPEDVQAEYDALPWYGKLDQAAGDTIRLMSNGLTFGQMDKFVGHMDGTGTEAERAKSADARARAGTAGIADEILGGGMAAMYLPSLGSGLVGSMGTGAVYGGVDGALRDADTLGERGMNALTGVGAGAALGGAAHGIASGVGAGVDALGRTWRNWGLAPEERAAARVSDLARQRFGADGLNEMDKAVTALGPDAARVDVLGEPALSMTRRAANVSPEARETAEGFAFGRQAGQNDRVAADIQRLGGLPEGSRVPVSQMKADAYAVERPKIRSAYDAARTAGSDANLDLFKDLIDTDVGSAAFDQAFKNVATRMATGGADASNLAVLDETARMLQGQATQAFRKGDPMAEVYADLGKSFKERLDGLLSGDEYALAREARAKAYRTAEAFDAGEGLAARAPGFEALGAGRKVGPTDAPHLARSYAQSKAEAILGQRPTPGALGQFTTSSGREASQISLGEEKAKTLADAVIGREQKYNRLPASLGNSSTARQMEDLGNPALDIAAAGLNYATGGVTGALTHLARAGAGRLGRHFSTQAQRKAAKPLVDVLTGSGPLKGRGLTPNILQKLYERTDPNLGRRFLIGGPIGALEAERDQNSMAGAFR